MDALPELGHGGSGMRGDRLVVLGSANLDLVMRQHRLPGPGETIFGHYHDEIPGGKGLNQAIAAARAGASVAFVGRVGDDAGGRRLADLLTSEGIDVAQLVVDPLKPTGVAHVSVLDGGENTVVVAAGANAGSDWARQDAELLQTAAMLVAQLERPAELVREAFRAARARSVTTVLTPAPVTPATAGLLPLVDILLLNESEATEVTGENDALHAAQRLSSDGMLVVMTRGPRSSIVALGGSVVHEEPTEATEVVDTTGAGDCFAGTLLARLVSGATLRTAIRSATVAASICVGRTGAAVSMPLSSEVAAAQS